jgi:uncharacterized membrane protein
MALAAKKFCTFRQSPVMSNEQKINMIEEELQRLTAQLSQQQQEVWTLRQQLKGLQPSIESETHITSYPAENTAVRPTLENLIGLRLIHIVGIIVLVIGLSLGVKYAIDKNLVSEGMRIILAYAAGAVLYILSVRLKKLYSAFSAILFSGAMASLYFTTYGAFVYYQFLSFTVAFLIMIALTFFTAYQSMVYNRQEIALLGLVGAYGIPFLISPNRGHPELLFLYISIINCGVVFVCAKKPWAVVGRAAQGISWSLFIGWAAWQNDASIKTYGLLFMMVFFVQFFFNAFSAKLFRKQSLSLNATYQLLLNNLLFYIAALFVFNYAFVDSTVALISLLFAALALAQTLIFHRWREPLTVRLFGYYALGLFVLFIGFQWDGITVTLLWLLTAVVLFATGLAFRSIPVRLASIALMGVTLLKLVALDSLRFSTLQKVIAYLVLGVLLLVVSFFYQKFKEQLFGGPRR